MKKVWIRLAAAAMVLSMFAGCSAETGSSSSSETGSSSSSSSSSAESSEQAEQSGEKVNLELFWYTDGIETEAMRRVLDKYEEDNPNITVEMMEVPYADLNNKLMMAISGGEPPALARVTSNQTFYDVALDLTDVFGGEEEFFALYPEFVRQDTDICLDGKIYTVPMEASITGLYYNATAFEKAGVSVPQSPDEIWTWEEFAEKLNTVMEKGGVQYGLAIDKTTQRWSTILYEFGGKYLNEDGNPAFTSDKTRECLEFTKEMFDNGTFVKSVYLGGEDANNLFRSGQVAAHLSGSWNITAVHDNVEDFEWGVTYLPYQEDRANIIGYKGVIGFQGSGVEEETKQLLLYLASKEASTSYCSESLFISPRLDCADIEYSFGQEIFAVLADEQAHAGEDSVFDMKYPGWYSACNTTIIDGLCSYIAGDITADEFMAEVDAKTAEVLAE